MTEQFLVPTKLLSFSAVRSEQLFGNAVFKRIMGMKNINPKVMLSFNLQNIDVDLPKIHFETQIGLVIQAIFHINFL